MRILALERQNSKFNPKEKDELVKLGDFRELGDDISLIEIDGILTGEKEHLEAVNVEHFDEECVVVEIELKVVRRFE